MHWIDPHQLQETRGTVSRFLLNPRGEPDGFILGKDRQVHFPPHLAKQVARHIGVGDKVRVRGLKPRAADMVAAVAITGPDGKMIVDNGPPHDKPHHGKPHGAMRPTVASGTVLLPLYGPKGELRGALLDDGTSLRMPPHAAEELQEYLQAGAHVQAWGDGVHNKHGRTLDLHDIAMLVDA